LTFCQPGLLRVRRAGEKFARTPLPSVADIQGIQTYLLLVGEARAWSLVEHYEVTIKAYSDD